MKEKMSQLFKDKVFLVLLVLGLLTIVAAAGVITIQRGNNDGQSPYLEVPDQKGVIAEETIPQENQVAVAGVPTLSRIWMRIHRLLIPPRLQRKQRQKQKPRRLRPERKRRRPQRLSSILTMQQRWHGRYQEMSFWITAWSPPSISRLLISINVIRASSFRAP